MTYTVIASNGQSYDLPSKTINVMEKLDVILKVDTQKGLTVKAKFQKLLDFCSDILGKEAIKDIFGTDKLENMDLSELTLLVLKIKDAYDEPITTYQNEKMFRDLDSIPSDKIVSMIDAVNKMDSVTK